MCSHDITSKVRERIKEGQSINKSLFFLTHVISLKSRGNKYILKLIIIYLLLIIGISIFLTEILL